MRGFFDDFFELGFGRAEDTIFNCDKTLDLNPATWVKTETGFKATCRTVGINPDDVKVEVTNGHINVSGESEYEGSKYNVSYRIPISDDVLSNITGLKYKTLNGLTYIYLEVERPERKKIKAVKI